MYLPVNAIERAFFRIIAGLAALAAIRQSERDTSRTNAPRHAPRKAQQMPRTTPLTDKLVTIFGGSGFIGRHVAEDLLQQNARVRIAARNPEEAFSLKPLAKLGQLQFARCNILDEASVRACVEGSHAVVNLVGSSEGDLPPEPRRRALPRKQFWRCLWAAHWRGVMRSGSARRSPCQW